MNGLRETLESTGCELQQVTVLATLNDPFRFDTPAGHRDGKWLAEMLDKLGIGRLHNRGIHYALLGQTKPNGEPYTSEDWDWLARPLDCARWLGYIEFDRIADERNLPPVIRLWKPPPPFTWVGGCDLDLPDIDAEITPRALMSEMHGTQPYHLVLFGEKSSLAPILGDIADRFQADLYLPTGEISDTMVYKMAKSTEDDPRPMIVFTIADCDPAGWQMPISIARKLQAHKARSFPQMHFQMRRVALRFDHVKKFQLPGSPLKATEKRADPWRKATGLEQTEVDSMLTLHPGEFRKIIVDAIEPFFDRTLERRVYEAKSQWLREAQALVDAHVRHDDLAEANDRLADLKEYVESEIDEINAMARIYSTASTATSICRRS
jgi:hypothetical protein